MIDNNTLEINKTQSHIVILAYSFIIVFSVSHRPIQWRAAAYNVKTAILDFIGAYTWQETLLLFVFLHETYGFTFGYSKSNVCQLGLFVCINILIITWSRLAFVLLNGWSPILSSCFRVLWFNHCCSPLLCINAGLSEIYYLILLTKFNLKWLGEGV